MDIADHFGCSRGKVERTLKAMDISPEGYKYKIVGKSISLLIIHSHHALFKHLLPGVEIERKEAKKPKFKPHTLRRVLRTDYFSKDVLELDSPDNVLAPLSLTDFGVFNKLSRYD